MKVITNDKMPAPNGHYSTCIAHNGILYLSGQLPKNPETKEIPEGIEAQTLQALKNVATVLNAAGSSKEDVIQMRLYIPNISMWDTVNAIYTDFFGNHKPARSVIPSRELHFNCLIEIEAIAVHHEV